MAAAVVVETVRRVPGATRAARWIRRTRDRLLHPWRRRAARRRVLQLGAVRTVLFVCQGNICRSPYAAHAFSAAIRRTGADGGTTARSAGFLAPDRPSPAEACAVARRRGLTLEQHRSQRVGAENLRDADLIAVMNAAQAGRLIRDHGVAASRIVILGDLDSQPVTSREIPDPVEQGEPVFEQTFDRIDRCLGVLLAWLTPRPGRGG